MKENIMKPIPIGFEKLLDRVTKTKKSNLDKKKKEIINKKGIQKNER